MAVIYKITNKFNNRSYIGKTKNLKLRLQQHRYSRKSYISRAIRKHGFSEFMVEILFETDDPMMLSKKEYEFIQTYNSFVPNGYNLTKKTDCRLYHIPETRRKNAILTQRRGRSKTDQRSSDFIGVVKNPKSRGFSTVLRYDYVTKTKSMPTEKEAAELYDKVALFCYGRDAKINFDEFRYRYTDETLNTAYLFFRERKAVASKYNFVRVRNGRWFVACYALNIPEVLKIRMFDTEEEAARIVDQLIVYYKLNKKRNFPGESLDVDEIWNDVQKYRTGAIQTSQHKGISFNKKSRRWVIYTVFHEKQRYVGISDTEEQARTIQRDFDDLDESRKLLFFEQKKEYHHRR